MDTSGDGKLQVCRSGHADVFGFEAISSSHVRLYLLDSFRSKILKKAHYAKIAITLMCVGYTGILWSLSGYGLVCLSWPPTFSQDHFVTSK